MKRFILSIAILLAGTALLFTELFFERSGAFLCGVCGLQERRVWLMDTLSAEPPYDEYGIHSRWQCAHSYQCEHVWIDGPLGGVESDYWPRLHLVIAQGADLKSILRIIERYPESVETRDVLGRTALHWAVLHPDDDVASALEKLLIEKGLTLEEEDKTGQSPKDWKEQCAAAGGGP